MPGMLTTDSPADLRQAARDVLRNMRSACEQAADLYALTSGIAVSDLTAAGMLAADAQAILSGVADANAIASIYNTGLPPTPSSYPQPPTAYPYSRSQRIVIGP